MPAIITYGLQILKPPAPLPRGDVKYMAIIILAIMIAMAIIVFRVEITNALAQLVEGIILLAFRTSDYILDIIR